MPTPDRAVSKAQGLGSPAMLPVEEALIAAGKVLAERVDRLRFSDPVSYVYNPLQYAWAPYEQYLRSYASGPRRVIFLGMNPGPFGMVQTGIPFGEVKAVKQWLRIEGEVVAPKRQHPARPITGFNCQRSEISGQRLWGFFAAQFGTPDRFFREHLVLNYCPLAFLEETGRNRTPDKLPASEKEALFGACDEHLQRAISALKPEWLVCIGGFACERGQEAKSQTGGTFKVCQILHPSPASPAANRGWAEAVLSQLRTHGVM